MKMTVETINAVECWVSSTRKRSFYLKIVEQKLLAFQFSIWTFQQSKTENGESMKNNTLRSFNHLNWFMFCTIPLWKTENDTFASNNGSCIFCTVGRGELFQKCSPSYVSSLAGTYKCYRYRMQTQLFNYFLFGKLFCKQLKHFQL